MIRGPSRCNLATVRVLRNTRDLNQWEVSKYSPGIHEENPTSRHFI